MLKFVKRFGRDRRATIALITAIFIFPLMFLGVGVPIDLARAIQYRAMLQNVADGAALAGSEALGIGATPAQACALTLAYINVPITNHELPAATLSATLTSPGGGVSICNGASGLSTPQTTQATAPNLVNVTISGSQPTTFLSLYKPSMPVSVATSAIGPQGFITICASPAPNPSGDLSQVYYYLRNSNGSLVNEDNSPVNPSSADTLPGASGGVSLLAFLGDDDYLHENPPLATNGYCNASHTEVAVLVKAGLAQRLGFAYYVVSNAQTPCIADPNFKANGGAAYWTSFSCLQGDVNYAYDPYNAATNIGGFFDYYQTYALPAYKNYLLPNAYGSPVGWVNAFYSTDYPASLNSNNLEAGYSGTGTPASPVAGDSCFTTYSNGTTVASVANGFTAVSQSCILNESVNTPNLALTAIFYPTNKTPTKAPNITPASGGSTNTNVVFWANWYQLQAYGGSTSTGTDLVCLASNGASYTPTITTYNRGTTKQYSVATFPKTADVQQENFIIANSSVAPNVYHCPVNTVGSPYYPDPTCAELNGATLQIAWNDMGGVLYDNGNYVDLVYSYSCKPPAATDTINSAIIQ
jgi:Flp pilus assembly protein TadG